ncbi:MAG: hypothetical protein MR429_03630 [Bifidobacterium animalis]|nr:hypothetical protein [Bifidobacterium animalis]
MKKIFSDTDATLLVVTIICLLALTTVLILTHDIALMIAIIVVMLANIVCMSARLFKNGK